MTISSTTSATATTATTSTAAATSGALKGTSDEFLKLFMAQLQNQDPINPQNSTDMVAQLAQFSSVEQQTQTNSSLTQLLAAQNGTTNASLSSLVGRQCNASVGTVSIDNMSAIPPIEVSAPGTITGGSIVVTNAAGKQVRTIPIPANGGEIQWDGKDSSGNTLPAGSYAVSVNTGTTTAAITAAWQGTVNSIQLGASGSSLRMGGILVAPGDITSIGAASATATPAVATVTNQGIKS